MSPARDRAFVVLVHGLWMPSLEMLPLQHRLEQQGYDCARFAYGPVHGTLEEMVSRLAHFAAEAGAPAVHFVAHSLGGLLLHHLFHRYPWLPGGRVVTLGTPHGGSHVARVLASVGLGPWLLGSGAAMGLLGDAPQWPAERELGVIAGTIGPGLGWVIPGLPQPNDGTVAVAETLCPGRRDHLQLPVSHMGLLLVEAVARQVLLFLDRGRFGQQPDGAGA